MASTLSLCQPCEGGLVVSIKVTPNAARNAIGTIEEDARGQQWLKVGITSIPEKGKANAQLIKFLSKQWKLPKTSIGIISGETSRYKKLFLSGNAFDIEKQVMQ